jgi:hypothetical protein
MSKNLETGPSWGATWDETNNRAGAGNPDRISSADTSYAASADQQWPKKANGRSRYGSRPTAIPLARSWNVPKWGSANRVSCPGSSTGTNSTPSC